MRVENNKVTFTPELVMCNIITKLYSIVTSFHASEIRQCKYLNNGITKKRYN